MFKSAADQLVSYSNADQNWPRYALLLHATELALKGYAKQREMQGEILGKQPANHDLHAWYELAVKHGLKDDPRIAEHISYLSDLHFTQFTRYPQQRAAPVGDLSSIADDTMEYLLQVIAPIVNPR